MNKRTSIFTKITSLVMAGALLAVSMPGTSLPVKADNTTIWTEDQLNKIIPDGNGGMQIAFQDKKHTSDTIYQTVGYNLTIHIPGQTEGITVRSSFVNPNTGAQNSTTTDYGNGKVQTVKSTSATTLEEAFITQYPDKGA